MRCGPDELRCPFSGETTEILHRPGQDSEHAEFLITLAGVGSGPGPHLHPGQVEHFHVVQGSVEVRVGDDTIRLGADEAVTVPTGTAHSFRALVAQTQVLRRLTPGHGFEAALEDVYELLDSGQLGPGGPIDPAVWNECFARHRQVMVSLRDRSAPGS